MKAKLITFKKNGNEIKIVSKEFEPVQGYKTIYTTSSEDTINPRLLSFCKVENGFAVCFGHGFIEDVNFQILSPMDNKSIAVRIFEGILFPSLALCKFVELTDPVSLHAVLSLREKALRQRQEEEQQRAARMQQREKELKEEEQKELRKRILSAVEIIREGSKQKKIDSETFLLVAKAYKFSIPIKTKGTINNRVSYILADGRALSLFNSKNKRGLDGTFAAIHGLFALVKEKNPSF